MPSLLEELCENVLFKNGILSIFKKDHYHIHGLMVIYTQWQKNAPPPGLRIWPPGAFLLQHRRQDRANQSVSGGHELLSPKEKSCRPSRRLFFFRDTVAYSKFVKRMAVGLMRMWRNARRVSRELNIHHKTIYRGGGHDGTKEKAQDLV